MFMEGNSAWQTYLIPFLCYWKAMCKYMFIHKQLCVCLHTCVAKFAHKETETQRCHQGFAEK